MTSIPSKFRKTAFDKFAPYLGQAIRQFPRALVIDPSPLTPDSFASAIRAARRAKQEYKYSSNHIDEMLWLKYHDKLICSVRVDGKIVLGSAETVKEPLAVKYGKAEGQSVTTLTNNYWLEKVCEMLSNRIFDPPINIRVSGTDSDTRARLEDKYDIAFIEDVNAPTTFIIL